MGDEGMAEIKNKTIIKIEFSDLSIPLKIAIIGIYIFMILYLTLFIIGMVVELTV